MCASGSVLTVRETTGGNEVRTEKRSVDLPFHFTSGDKRFHLEQKDARVEQPLFCLWCTAPLGAAVHRHTVGRHGRAERWK